MLLNSYLCKGEIIPTYNEFDSYVPYDCEYGYIPDNVEDIFTFNSNLDDMFRFIEASPCDYVRDEDNVAIFDGYRDINCYENVYFYDL